MKKSTLFFLISISMFIVMVIFISYAISHPTFTFPGGIKIAYPFYIIYFLTMIIIFIMSIIFKIKKK